MNKYLGIGAIVIGVLLLVVPGSPISLGSSGYANCKTTTETSVSVGDDNSVTVLSAKSGRSYAMIQHVKNSAGAATNTVSIAFGATATLGNGIELSTTTPNVEFGMDTKHPYSGIVTAITSVGSTTVRVTECR